MLNVCMYRYWAGYLYLCCELKRRTDAFSTICHLDDISLLEEPDGKTVFQNLHSSSGACNRLRGKLVILGCIRSSVEVLNLISNLYFTHYFFK